MGVWRAAEQCSEQNIEVDPWPTVFMCAKNEGESILGEFVEETQSAGIDITHQNIPVVTINGNVSEEAVTNLIEALCQQFVSIAKRDTKISHNYCDLRMKTIDQINAMKERHRNWTSMSTTSQ